MFRSFLLSLAVCSLVGCATQTPQGVFGPAQLTPQTPSGADIASFPEPRGKIPVAVYSFKDQTGQYKASPGSSFSTAVTQGATAILTKALKDSGWFMPVERENLQDILTERKIARAIDQPAVDKAGQPAQVRNLPPLISANLIIEGSIVGYDENVKTGGVGAKYFGISLSDQYRIDQVTVNLRAIDINSGQVLESVSASKTVYSILLDSGFYRFVTFKKLLEAEIGITETEPTAICVEEAIRTALAHLIVQGIANNLWTVKEAADLEAPIIKDYLVRYRSSIAPRRDRSSQQKVAQKSETPAPVVTPAAAATPTQSPAEPPVALALESAPVAPAPPTAIPEVKVEPDPLLKSAEQEKLAAKAKLIDEVAAACTRTDLCRACFAGTNKKAKECNICYTRAKDCKRLKGELQNLYGVSDAGQQSTPVAGTKKPRVQAAKSKAPVKTASATPSDLP